MFGGNTIDLREAVFESNVCEIDVFCMFGGIDVKVPEGVDVDNQTIAVFGGSDTKRLPPPIRGRRRWSSGGSSRSAASPSRAAGRPRAPTTDGGVRGVGSGVDDRGGSVDEG